MPPEPAAVEVRDEGVAETLRHVEILGRLILRTLHRLEKTMADQNYTMADILAATKEQQGLAASMSTMLTAIHARVMALVAGQVDPQTQASINEAFAEIKGNSNALAQAITTYTPDATAGQAATGTSTGAATGSASGSTGSMGSASTAAQPSATSTTLSTSKAVVNVGDTVTFSAGVSSSTGNANAITGSVTFSSDGGAIGSAALDSTGVAAISLPVPAGDHSITATYSGDANYASSTSEPITQSAVTPPAPTGTQQAAASGASQGVAQQSGS